MIRPAPGAAWALGGGSPVLLAVALLAPSWWPLGIGWLAFVLAIGLADAFALIFVHVEARVDCPRVLHLGDRASAILSLRTERPVRAEFIVDVEGPIQPFEAGTVRVFKREVAKCELPINTLRRGRVRLPRVWLSIRGPLGFMARTVRRELGVEAAVVPNVAAIKRQALTFMAQDAPLGVKPQFQKGSGTEFEALREYLPGLDPRGIDWKHSARHRKLLCKEFQTERNHHVVLAIDTGRLMEEDLDGIPKLDRGFQALLFMSYVSLKAGDRVGFCAFDARTRAFLAPAGGYGVISRIQSSFAALDYTTEETNFTLALAELSGRLRRRSLVVIVTDFVDTVSAELMIENMGRLAQRHLLVFAALSNPALQRQFEQRPENIEAAARSVLAHELMRERRAVFSRLRRLGILCIETSAEQLDSALISRYLAIKHRDLI